MNLALLLACLCFASCQAAKLDADPAAKLTANPSGNFVQQQTKEKGFLEWISGLLGGGPTTSSPVVNDPPISDIECPVCQCGIARTKRRIVGGYETREREYPWMAMLLYNGRMFCGAALINDLYVMTAAHCAGFRKERLTVRLLEHDVSDRGNDTKIIDRKVTKVIRHQRYNPGTYDNDIALMKLDQRIDLSNAIKKRARNDADASTVAETSASAIASSDGVAAATETSSAAAVTSTAIEETLPDVGMTTTGGEVTTLTPDPEEEDVRVRPVCLPTRGLSFTNFTGVVIGWGVTEQGGFVSNTLQEVKVPIVSNKECRDRSYGSRLSDNMLCAGEPTGGRDACQGDSGGPLHIFNETTGKYQEVGVVSWGEGCAQPDKYGVYSRVNRYLTWIKSNTADACYCS